MNLWNRLLYNTCTRENEQVQRLALQYQSENESFGSISSLCPIIPSTLNGSSVIEFDAQLRLHHEVLVKELGVLITEKNYTGIAFGEIDPKQTKEFGHLSKWRTIWLYFIGQMVAEKRWEQELPVLSKIVRENCQDLGLVMVSILLPGTTLPAHYGPTRSMLRFHYPLLLPRKPENQHLYGMNIDRKPFQWKLKQSVLFDDTLLHSAKNETSDEIRVVIFADVFRPTLPWMMNWLNRIIYRLIQQTRHIKSIQMKLDREGKGFQ
jgi:hypothetical protein